MAKRYQKRKRRPDREGHATPDEVWISDVGKAGLFVISCNKAILDTEAQRQLWINYKVGGVFLTSGQENKAAVLLLVLRKMEWLEIVDSTVERPFAYTMPMKGNATRVL
jgi:hypothetical protein